MKPTRRTLLASGVASAVAALLARLPRTRPSPTGPVPRPEFGGPAVYAGQPWECLVANVAGVVLGRSIGVLGDVKDGPGRELRFDFPPGTVHGSVIEALVISPLGHAERRMISPLHVGYADSLRVICPLRLDGSVA